MITTSQLNPVDLSLNRIMSHALDACAAGNCEGPISQWPALSTALEGFGREFPADTEVRGLRGLCKEIVETFK